MAQAFKVIVLDGDPTGSQMVHGCPLLLRWDPDTLRLGLADPSPLMFVLLNTRSLAPAEAHARVREAGHAFQLVLAEAREAGWIERWLLVSRGDATLRGHFPLELKAITSVFGVPYLCVLSPAFMPGCRTTRGAVHYLADRPVAYTPFAADSLFGYRSSDLRHWIEEKTSAEVLARDVVYLSLDCLRLANRDSVERTRLLDRLLVLDRATYLIADAVIQDDLDVLASLLMDLLFGEVA